MIRLVLAFCLLASAGCAHAEPGREAFPDVTALAPDVIVEARYVGDDNFVGRPVDGYDANKCLLTKEAAAALAAAQADLSAFGLRFRIYDCYRPQRAVDHFVRWAQDENDTARKADYYPNVPKDELFERGYIAEKSGHSRGSTVDLTIEGLDMGSPWDFFDEKSHTEYESLPAQARANRLFLKTLMSRHGFNNYAKEWWHFTLNDEPFPETWFNFPVE